MTFDRRLDLILRNPSKRRGSTAKKFLVEFLDRPRHLLAGRVSLFIDTHLLSSFLPDFAFHVGLCSRRSCLYYYIEYVTFHRDARQRFKSTGSHRLDCPLRGTRPDDAASGS